MNTELIYGFASIVYTIFFIMLIFKTKLNGKYIRNLNKGIKQEEIKQPKIKEKITEPEIKDENEIVLKYNNW